MAHVTPSQAGKVALVTGGDMGIGFETALALAKVGARVMITARPPGTGAEAVERIRSASGNPAVDAIPVELASFDSIRKAAEQVRASTSQLDILVNNAGGVLTTHRRTEQGFDMTFGVNYLGPFLLTNLLHPLLVSAGTSRVVNLSSSQHRQAGALDLDALQHIGQTDGIKAYNYSKLAMLMFATELARRWRSDGVSGYAVQPGAVRSNFGRHGETGGSTAIALRLLRPLMIPPAKGAGASVFCATEPGLETETGGYFQRGMQGNTGRVRRVAPSKFAEDKSVAQQLWERSDDLIMAASPASRPPSA